MVVPLYAAGICALLWFERRLGVHNENPVEGVVIAVGFGAFAVVGALLVAKRSANVVGWIMVALALMVGLFPAGDAYAAYVMTARGRPDALAVAGAWFQSWYWFFLLGLAFVYLPLLFPDGRLPSRRWLPVAVLAGIGILGLVVLGMLTDTLSGQNVDYRIENPIGIEGLRPVEDLPVFGVLGALFAVGLFGAVASVVVRFRRSRGVERQQMKWFLLATAPILLLPLTDYVPGAVGSVVFGFVLIALPTAIGVAILRYRLYDIDLVINRTLVYGTLTALVVGIYVLVVGGLGALLRVQGNLLVSLVAAGIVAVLFAPLRERVQRGVNRLMYGERDEPYAVLSRLGERLGATLEPEAVLPTIARTVREALKLPYAGISLGDEEGPVVAEHGSPVADPLRVPLVYRGEPIGQLLLGPRAGEGGFSAADRRLLADLARQAGIAVHAARLTNDLQRSRERLIAAREEERRRLRRDLHDGLGPTLGSLALKLDVAGDMVEGDPAATRTLLRGLKEQAQSAVADVRRLVYALRPPALDDLGLLGAIRETAAQHDAGRLRISVDAPERLPPLPAAVEVAAYRIAQEALTNVARHAGASRCTVRLALDEQDGRLQLEVADDGRGLSPARGRGVGLVSMRERAEELGGECVVESLPEGGTRVRASLPLAPSVGPEG